jgi:hypothetical protein
MGLIQPSFISEKIANRVNTNQAIAQARVESNLENVSTRFEQHVYDRFISEGISPSEAKALATSYGLFQIMGYNLKTMGIDVTKPEVAKNYLISPTSQVNSYVQFSLALAKEYPKQNDFLAAYNGGPAAVTQFKQIGYYGKAEPYVYKVKGLMEALTPDDRLRYTKYQAQSQWFIVPVVILISGKLLLSLINGGDDE